MLPVREGVLGIELQLVNFPAGQHVDQLIKSLKRWHFVAAHVEHHATHWEIRPILDGQRRQLCASLLYDLQQRADAIKHASRIMANQRNTGRADA